MKTFCTVAGSSFTSKKIIVASLCRDFDVVLVKDRTDIGSPEAVIN